MNSPSSDQPLSQQAALLHRSGKLEEAERLYLAALAADAQDVTALHFLGVLRAQQGRIAEALEKIDAARALAPMTPKSVSIAPMCSKARAARKKRWRSMTRRWC